MNCFRAKHHKIKGFTRNELLVVIAILGLIIAIAIPNLMSARRYANSFSAQQTLRNLHAAQVTYCNCTGNYANNLVYLGGHSTTSVCCILDFSVDPPKLLPEPFVIGNLRTTPATKSRMPRYSAFIFPRESWGFVRTGDDCFYVDETGIVRHSGSPTELATEASPPVE